MTNEVALENDAHVSRLNLYHVQQHCLLRLRPGHFPVSVRGAWLTADKLTFSRSRAAVSHRLTRAMVRSTATRKALTIGRAPPFTTFSQACRAKQGIRQCSTGVSTTLEAAGSKVLHGQSWHEKHCAQSAQEGMILWPGLRIWEMCQTGRGAAGVSAGVMMKSLRSPGQHHA